MWFIIEGVDSSPLLPAFPPPFLCPLIPFCAHVEGQRCDERKPPPSHRIFRLSSFPLHHMEKLPGGFVPFFFLRFRLRLAERRVGSLSISSHRFDF